MKKIILVVLVLSLVVPTLLIFPGSVRACGGREPVTLLGLVRESSTIHIATYRGQDEGEVKTEEEMRFREIKLNFDVSSTLKGESAKFVALQDRKYLYDEVAVRPAELEEAAATHHLPEMKTENQGEENTDADGEADANVDEESEEFDEEGRKPLKAGDNVLLFLTLDEESKELRPTDWVDGIKSLTPAEIDVFAERIKEIKPILAAEKPNAAKIIDWLVALTEDPVTRWDGAYELEMSFYALEQKSALEAEQKKTPVKEGEEGLENPYTSDTLETGLATMFAGQLTEYHKQTLTNVLMQSRLRRAQDKQGSDALVNGDRELMRIVSRWADDRVASEFIEQIRAGGYTSYDQASLMTHIAGILGDKELGSMAEKFDEIVYQEDDEIVVASKAEANIEPAVEEKPAAPEVTITVAAQTEPNAEKPAAKTAGKKPVVTYKRLRDDMTTKFLKRAEAVIAENQVRTAR